MNFAETVAGQRFLNHDFPSLVKSAERIAKAMEEQNKTAAKPILEDLDMADDSLDRLKTANPYIAHEKLDDRYRMTATDASASRCRPWRRCEMYAKSSTADAPSILS